MHFRPEPPDLQSYGVDIQSVALRIGAASHGRQPLAGNIAERGLGSLTAFIADVGLAKASTALNVSAARLKPLLLGARFRPNEKLIQLVIARLPDAICDMASQREVTRVELEALRKIIARVGLREAARQRGSDPSNLRRTLVGHLNP